MQPGSTTVQPREFRDACGSFGTGVTVISTRLGDEVHAMTANAFMSISLDPPLIAISIGENARMLAFLRAARVFSVSVLNEDMETLALHFAGRPGLQGELPFVEMGGLPVIDRAASAFVADVREMIEAGDHVIVIGTVREIGHDPAVRPLLFHAGRFQQLA